MKRIIVVITIFWGLQISYGQTTVTGSGGQYCIPRFTSSGTGSVIGNSSIYDNGKVGIGTTSPDGTSKLSLFDATYPTLALSNGTYYGWLGIATSAGNYANFASLGDLVLKTSSSNIILTARATTGKILFGTGYPDQVRMTILTNGNVGIGTTSPLYGLDVNGAMHTNNGLYANFAFVGDGADGQAQLGNNDDFSGNETGLYETNNGDAIAVRDYNDDAYYYAAGNITSSEGYVGIGTQSPLATLDVNGVIRSSQRLQVLGNYTPDTRGGMELSYDAIANGGQGGLEIYAPNTVVPKPLGLTAQVFRFNTGTSQSTLAERMRINSDGNVGIGTTSPSYNLDVTGSIRSVGGTIRTELASNEGGNVAFDNPNKTGATTKEWKIWNMTGGYGNALKFWRYYADGTNAGPSVTFWDNGNVDMTNNLFVAGNVGIGTPTPSEKLEVGGNFSINNGGADGGRIIWKSNGYNDWRARNINGGLGFFPGEGAATALWLSSGGNVGVGTTSTGTCKLAVEGMIGAREVQVVASGTSWPDFVFADGYHLQSLEEIERHIKTEKHLPGIPSQQEVTKDGIKLGEMQTKLLQKVEELTLYVIELKKENDALKKRVEKVETK
jgi:hypothetical protein